MQTIAETARLLVADMPLEVFNPDRSGVSLADGLASVRARVAETVYRGVREAEAALRNDLQAQLLTLEARVATLEHR